MTQDVKINQTRIPLKIERIALSFQQRKLGTLLAFICLLILGTMPVVANSRPTASSPLEFAIGLTFWQLLFATPHFVYELSKGSFNGLGLDNLKVIRIRTYVICLSTGLMFGISTWFYVLALEKAGTVNASIAIQSYPLFALIVEMVLLRQRKSFQEVLITLALVLALYYLGTQGSWHVSGLSIWFLVALSVPLIWSVAHVLIRQELIHTKVTPAQVTFIRLLISIIFLILIHRGTGGILSRVFTSELLPFAILMGLLYYMELIVWFYAMKYIDVSLASAITTPWPVVTMVLSLVLLGEKIQWYQIWAFLIVAACIYALLAFTVIRDR